MNLLQMKYVSNFNYVDRDFLLEDEEGLLKEGSFSIRVSDNDKYINIHLWKLNEYNGIKTTEKIRIPKNKVDQHIRNLFHIWQNCEFLYYLQIYHEIKMIQKNY